MGEQADEVLLDLPGASVTLPQRGTEEVDRSPTLVQIHTMLRDKRGPLVVVGPHGSGKTVLLCQYVRRYSDRAISFFVGTDYWRTQPLGFLLSCCLQMQTIVPRYRDISFEALDQQALGDWFTRLYSSVAKEGRTSGRPFIFVVDSLDRIPESYGQSSILTLMPTDPLDGIRVLASCTPETTLPFQHDVLAMPMLSEVETAHYLRDVMDGVSAATLYHASAGLPGYVAHVRQQIIGGTSVHEILANPAGSLAELYERDWKSVEQSSDELRSLLALAAFSDNELSDAMVESILGLKTAAIREILTDSAPFATTAEPSGEITFRSDSHKHFVCQKLESRRPWAIARLIHYYEADSHSPEAMRRLPVLYSRSNSYDGIRQLVSVDYIARMLAGEGGFDLAHGRTALHLLGDMAYNAKDWDTLAFSSVANSILGELCGEVAPLEGKVEALLGRKRYDDAIRLAYSSKLASDRLHMLARVCNRLHAEGTPISSDLTDTMDQLLHRLPTDPELRNKLFDTAANLFPARPGLSLQILEHMVSGVEGATRGRVLDMLLSGLLISLDFSEDETTAEVENRIRDERLRDFARAVSPQMTRLSADGVISEAAGLQDESARLFLLRSWCNSNRENAEAHRVVRAAIDIMMMSTSGFAPTMRELRQFSEAIVRSCPRDTAEPLVHRIDMLKDTLVSSPEDEKSRLEMSLARAECSWGEESGIYRLYDTYLATDSVRDPGIRCFILIHILQAIDAVCPDDFRLRDEVKSKVIKSFEESLLDSAEQFKQHRRSIRALARYDMDLAISFAERMNTEIRRDLAYEEILRSYVTQEDMPLDARTVRELTDRFGEPSSREVVEARVLRLIATRDVLPQIGNGCLLIEMARRISSASLKARSAAYCIVALKGTNPESMSELESILLTSFHEIGDPVRKVAEGYRLCSILAPVEPRLAEKLYITSDGEESRTALCNPVIGDVFSTVCDLAIRTVPVVCKSDRQPELVAGLISLVERVASPHAKSRLLSTLGLRLYKAGSNDGFRRASERCLEILDCLTDEGTKKSALLVCAPLLYEYERGILDKKVAAYSDLYQDAVRTEVLKYILGGRPSSDPVDLRQLRRTLEPRDLQRACDIAGEAHVDHTVYTFVSTIVDNMIDRDPRCKEPLRFDEKHALEAVESLANTVAAKLPDPRNISHRGYLIAAQGWLRSACEIAVQTRRFRANKRWQALAIPTWGELRGSARLIPNNSDRALVLIMLGKASARNASFAEACLDEASGLVSDVANALDRLDLFCLLAESYSRISHDEAAKYAIEQALPLFEAMSAEETADQVSERIIEIGHAIEPDFGAALASRMDKPLVRERAERESRALQLLNDPDRLGRESNRQAPVHLACTMILEAFCSGKSVVQSEDVVGKWLSETRDQGLETSVLAASWFIENLVSGSRSKALQRLEGLLGRNMQLAELISYVSGIMLCSAVSVDGDSNRIVSPVPSTRLRPILVGEREIAMRIISDWLAENGFPYVKIYDPYFSVGDLEILKNIRTDSSVTIITSWRSASSGDSTVVNTKEEYRKSWAQLSVQRPPHTQVYMVGSSTTLRTPVHNRYIIGSRRGIELGTSLNGLGISDSAIMFLEEDEKAVIERDLVDRIVCNPQPEYRGHKMDYGVFTL